MSTVQELVEDIRYKLEHDLAAVDSADISDDEKTRRKAVLTDEADDMIERLLS